MFRSHSNNNNSLYSQSTCLKIDNYAFYQGFPQLKVTHKTNRRQEKFIVNWMIYHIHMPQGLGNFCFTFICTFCTVEKKVQVGLYVQGLGNFVLLSSVVYFLYIWNIFIYLPIYRQGKMQTFFYKLGTKIGYCRGHFLHFKEACNQG